MDQQSSNEQPASEYGPVVGENLVQNWSGFAIAGFIISLAFFIPFTHLLAIVFSILGIRNTGPSRKRGRVLAIIGLVIASVNLVVGAVLGGIAGSGMQ